VVDARGERLTRKIAEAHEQGVPLVAVAGEREAERGSLSFRWRDGRQEELSLQEAARRFRAPGGLSRAEPPMAASAGPAGRRLRRERTPPR